MIAAVRIRNRNRFMLAMLHQRAATQLHMLVILKRHASLSELLEPEKRTFNCVQPLHHRIA
jgi:hypothetical protein